MSVTTDKLSYFITDTRGQKLCLLHSVSVTFPEAAVTCIMGPSGAGKTTLMNLIAGVTKRGYISGKINVSDDHGVAYVECFDFHIPEFTVLQNLYFSGMLRVGKPMSYQECVKLCTETAEMVGLEHVMDVVVGSGTNKGISGGQMKLLSIANELLSLPAVLCLDEPTSGEWNIIII
jgi:ABC-type multidrug transport system ATPase subunit